MGSEGILLSRLINVTGFLLIVAALFIAAGGFGAFPLVCSLIAAPLLLLSLTSLISDTHLKGRIFENVPPIYRISIKTGFFGFTFVIFTLATRHPPSALFLVFILSWGGDMTRGGGLIRIVFAGLLFTGFTYGIEDAGTVMRLNWLFFPGVLLSLFSLQLMFEKKGRMESGARTSAEALLSVLVFTSLPAFLAWAGTETAASFLFPIRQRSSQVEAERFAGTHFDFGILFDAAIITALIVLMVFLYRRMRRNSAQKGVDEEDAIALFASSRSLHLQRKKGDYSGPEENTRIIRLYHSFLDLLSGQGFSLKNFETPLELAEELAGKGFVSGPGIREFVMFYLKARFSGKNLKKDDVVSAESSFGLLKEQIRAGR